MSCSAGCLANLYWRSIKRVVGIKNHDRYVADFPGQKDNSKLDLWEEAKVTDGELAAYGIRGGVYVFDEKILRCGTSRLVNTIKTMPAEIRRSISSDGIPWIYCGRADRLVGQADDELIEHVVIMCTAMGLMENVGIKGSSAPITYVQVDDIGLARKERIKKRDKQIRCLAYW